MAKLSRKASFKGQYIHSSGAIVESNKDGEFVYDLMKTLKEFDGAVISVSINEDTLPQPVETDYDLDDDYSEDE